jgi:uncharacterized NAD(P)/FAD-binding protein YdhS
VAIVGGGYSGIVQAIELLRRDCRVTLIERAPRLARGVAYSTSRPEHLLNVRASGMSALADQRADFVGWLAERTAAGPDGFAPRHLYGAYLETLLAEARGSSAAMEIVTGEAVDLLEPAGLRLADGRMIAADATILAVGNLPPARPRYIPADLGAGIYVRDPWSGDWLADLRDTDQVLLVGTGLTAVDAILSLDAVGFAGSILAVSRRGLLPRAHATGPAPAPPPPSPAPRPDCLSLLASVRRRADMLGWRGAVDSLRPITQQLWGEASLAERQRFLRHLRPWWDVHRHRIAPQVAERVQGMRSSGKLRVAAGRISGVTVSPAGADVRWRPRGGTAAEQISVRRIVDCTGPQADIRRAGEPLLAALLHDGRIRADPCRIGIDVDRHCRILDHNGLAAARLFAVGPLTRSTFWESVAVPDIRVLARDLADTIATSCRSGSLPLAQNGAKSIISK